MGRIPLAVALWVYDYRLKSWDGRLSPSPPHPLQQSHPSASNPPRPPDLHTVNELAVPLLSTPPLYLLDLS